jgi:hypothetical protein
VIATNSAGSNRLRNAISARLRVGPPGIIFFAATIAAVVLAVDTNTRGSLGMLLVTAPIWLALAVAWFVRWAIAGTRARWRLSPSAWARWLAIPLVLGVVFAITRTDVLIDARFNLSRDAMNALARDISAGGSRSRGWVGLYAVGTIDLTENGFRFVVDDSGLGRSGFAYATAGQPAFVEDEGEAAGVWTGPSFQSIGDGWWRWTEEWD